MSRITETLVAQRRKGNASLIPFVTAGDPSREFTVEFVQDLEQAGADVVELGIPYSDPIADGPVIQAASLRALQNGFQLPHIFDLVAGIRQRGVKLPIVLFTYANPVFQYGIESFLQRAKDAGADGIIVPDLPVEESADLLRIADRFQIDAISLVAPTSQSRMEMICKQSRGFVYCVSSLGVTGERDRLADNLDTFLAQVRQYADVPVAVGFGISRPEQARQVGMQAEAVIIGSAIVRRIGEIADALRQNQEQLAQELREQLLEWVRSCKKTLEGVV
jgi:tryptophan synthase alpha chain